MNISTWLELSVYCLYWYVVAAIIFKLGSINSSSSIRRHLSTLALDLKLIHFGLRCLFLIWCASGICKFSSLFRCSNIVFSIKNFENSVVGQKLF